MDILPTCLGRLDSPLIGFTGDEVPVERVITLPIVVGRSPRWSESQVDFLVVRTWSAYNANLRCPGLNTLQAVVSTYHLKMKFSTKFGVDEVRGDQVLAQQYYTITLRGTRPSEAYLVDGLDIWDELSKERERPVEDLETIPLNDGNKEHTVQIGSKLNQGTKKYLISFLQKNTDVFIWTPVDMPGIDPEVMTHRLSINPNYRPIKQKKKSFVPEWLSQ